MIIGEVDGSDFAILYAHRKSEIQRLSRSQYVPGLDPDDIETELRMALWKAHNTWDPSAGTTIGQWWWVIWTNRKADLIRHWFARLEPEDTMDPEVVTSMAADMPDRHSRSYAAPPEDFCELEVEMWRLLNDGWEMTAICQQLGIGRKLYYRILDSWRTEDLYDHLTGAA